MLPHQTNPHINSSDLPRALHEVHHLPKRRLKRHGAGRTSNPKVHLMVRSVPPVRHDRELRECGERTLRCLQHQEIRTNIVVVDCILRCSYLVHDGGERLVQEISAGGWDGGEDVRVAREGSWQGRGEPGPYVDRKLEADCPFLWCLYCSGPCLQKNKDIETKVVHETEYIKIFFLRPAMICLCFADNYLCRGQWDSTCKQEQFADLKLRTYQLKETHAHTHIYIFCQVNLLWRYRIFAIFMPLFRWNFAKKFNTETLN